MHLHVDNLVVGGLPSRRTHSALGWVLRHDATPAGHLDRSRGDDRFGRARRPHRHRRSRAVGHLGGARTVPATSKWGGDDEHWVSMLQEETDTALERTGREWARRPPSTYPSRVRVPVPVPAPSRRSVRGRSTGATAAGAHRAHTGKPRAQTTACGCVCARLAWLRAVHPPPAPCGAGGGRGGDAANRAHAGRPRAQSRRRVPGPSRRLIGPVRYSRSSPPCRRCRPGSRCRTACGAGHRGLSWPKPASGPNPNGRPRCAVRRAPRSRNG